MTDWMLSGLCAQTDPDCFHPERGESMLTAKRICVRCPVRAECLAFALEHNESMGVWGGLTPNERRRLRVEAA